MLERNSLTSRDPPPVGWTEVSLDLCFRVLLGRVTFSTVFGVLREHSLLQTSQNDRTEFIFSLMVTRLVLALPEPEHALIPALSETEAVSETPPCA